MQAPPPSYTAASGSAPAPLVPPHDPSYGGGAPTAAPAEPARSKVGKSYVGGWQTSCLGVCCSDPGLCCYAQFCLPCLIVSQRLELMKTHSPPLQEYICCMGRFGGQWCAEHCGGCGCGPHPINGSCATCCLCTEAVCCFFASVPAHRREIQDQFGIDQGKEEWGAHAIACLSWVPVFGFWGGCFVGWVAYALYACLAAQNEVEIRARAGPAKQTMM